MEQVKYFLVTVKLQEETDQMDKVGNPKIRKWKETWVVNASTSDVANKIVIEEYNGSSAEWRIASVKETDYLGVLGDAD